MEGGIPSREKGHSVEGERERWESGTKIGLNGAYPLEPEGFLMILATNFMTLEY